MNEEPVQDAQSGWQVRQERLPEDEKVPEGQAETHWPLEASWEEDEQVRQKLDAPIHVPQEESHAMEINVNLDLIQRGEKYVPIQVKLSCGETNVPEGQLSRHCPWDRTNPGKHPVHCSWFTVDAALKLGILHDVHLAPQARRAVQNQCSE